MRRRLVGAVLTGTLAASALTGGVRQSPDTAPYGPVVVLGELATADRVAVLVPGVGVDPAHLDRPDQVLGMARALRAEARRVRPSVRLAVVAWADYPAPSGLGVAAVTGTAARRGAPRLHAYLGALRRTTDAPVALFCHSYGTVVCGLTPLAGRVSDVVLYGSPGARVRSAADFGPDVRVWAARSDADWIRFVPHVRIGDLGHGTDPLAPAFGARRLPSGGVPRHGGYYAAGSQTLHGFACIATGGQPTSAARPIG